MMISLNGYGVNKMRSLLFGRLSLELLSITVSPTSTYIIKTDIEGYDCKVTIEIGNIDSRLHVVCSQV